MLQVDRHQKHIFKTVAARQKFRFYVFSKAVETYRKSSKVAKTLAEKTFVALKSLSNDSKTSKTFVNKLRLTRLHAASKIVVTKTLAEKSPVLRLFKSRRSNTIVALRFKSIVVLSIAV